MKEGRHRLHDGKIGAALAIRITPEAKVNEIAGVQSDGTVKIHLVAALEGDGLNDGLIEFLSGILDVPVERIQIVAGSAGSDKLVTIDDMDAHSLNLMILSRSS
jgi:uncharacterized protein YggU (UPF0235/DUF167 family)